MFSGKQNTNPSSCCPPPTPFCPPIIIKTKTQRQEGRTVVFQLPPVNIVCEIPPPPKNTNPPKVCYIPIVCCEEGDITVGPTGPRTSANCQPSPNGNGRGYPF